MSATPDPYLLASALLTPDELPKLALVTYEASSSSSSSSSSSKNVASGSTSPSSPAPHTQRIFVIVSNVSVGVEQSCILVIKPRRRDPNTAVLLSAIPILPDLRIEIEPIQGLTASSATPRNHVPAATTLGLSSLPQSLPSIHTLLESIVPEVFDKRAEQDSSNAALRLTLSHGAQAASGITSDVSGLKDFLSVLKDLLRIAQENAFDGSKTHQWIKAYTEDLSKDTSQHSSGDAGHGDTPQLATPIFSRFSHSAFLPSSSTSHAAAAAAAEGIARPASPAASDIRISIGTFNVNGHLPPDDIPTVIGLKMWLRAEQDPDLLVLGLQEVDTSGGAYLYHSPAREDAWVRAITRALGRRADKYRKIASKQMVGLMLLVFASVELDDADEVATASVGVGLGGFVANKGAVAARLKVGERTLCFVNSHLSAFDGLQAMERRCWDWSEIYKRLRFRLEMGKTEDFWTTPGRAGAEGEGQGQEVDGENRFKTAQDVKEGAAGTSTEQAGYGNEPNGNGGVTSAPRLVTTANGDAATKDVADQLTAATSLDITSDFQPPPVSPSLPTTTTTSSSSSPPYIEQSITDHDIIFHFGDLNFRLDLSHAEAHRLIRQRDFSTLYRYDQLESLRTSGSLFDDFHEGRTEAFAPTYKFDRGTDRYDTSDKQRVPAWTDRILYCVTREWQEAAERGRVESVSAEEEGGTGGNESESERRRKQGVVLQAYEAVTELKFSDHRPVRATFVVRVR